MAALGITADQYHYSKHSRNEVFWLTVTNDTWQLQRLNSVDVISAPPEHNGEIFTAYRS